MERKTLIQTLGIAGLTIIIIGAIVVFSERPSTHTVEADNEGLTVVRKNTDILDSDRDGLPDWEEALWNTDIYNADSDGDGLNDGEEVDIGRHPGVAGPNDQLEDLRSAPEVEREPLTNDTVFTKTKKASINLLADYLRTKQFGTFDDTSIESLALEFAKNVDPDPAVEHYERELTVTDDESNNSLRLYGNAIWDIAVSVPYSPGEELAIVEQMVKTNDDELAGKLDPIADNYERVALELIATTVPEPFVEKHLSIINGYEELVRNIRTMKVSVADPALGLSVLVDHPNAVDKVVTSFSAISGELKKRGVSFEQGEGGYNLINTI